MAADDYLNTPAGQGIPDLDSSQPLSGNRPASGARRATPGEVLSQGFQGAQNAGDFLGLDTEFTASQDPNQVFGASSPLDLVPPPSTYVDDGSQPVDPQQVDPALPAVDPAQEFGEAPSAFEFGEDLGSEEGEAALDQEGAPSRRPVLITALLVAGLAGGGMYYGAKFYGRFFGPSTEVAVVTAPVNETGAPAADSQPSHSDAVSSGTPKPTSESGATTKDMPSVTAPGAVSSAKDARKPGVPSRSSTTPTSGPSGARSSEPEASVEHGQPEGGASLPTVTGVANSVRPNQTGFPDLESSEYAWASADQLELIWRGSEVPLEAVHAPAKTLMPRVGNVRVFTTAGDVFDGRLYAVGQNRVWLDAEPGRIGLDGERVEKIEVLGPPATGVQTSGTSTTKDAGKKRVRVRVPGGMLYGSVLKAEGDEVILALDDGGRVRVKAGDLEDLGSGRAVVVRR